MNKAVKRRAILCSLLTIALCISLVAGVSFALFHGTAGGSVQITAGKINLSAVIDSDSIMSDKVDGEEVIKAYIADDNKSKLIIKNVSSGYGVKFKINVTNESTIPVKYRIKFIGDGNLTLFDAMQIKIDEVAKTKTSYQSLSKGATDIEVSVHFEEFDINAVQEATCELSYVIEAVQANASEESESKVVSVRTPHEFIWALDEVLAGADKTIKLIGDIDLRGSLPRSAEGKKVTIDGNGKAITLGNSLFEELNGGKYVFNNITFDNPEAQAASRVALMSVRKTADNGESSCNGAIAGSIDGNADVTINGCKVKDRNFDGGEKGAGAFVGSVGKGSTVTFENCSVEKSKINGGSTGYFVGKTSGEITFKGGCSVSESSVENLNPASNNYVGSVEASSGGEGETAGETLPDVKVLLAEGVYLNNGVYEIYSADGLLWLDEQVTKYNNTFRDEKFILTENINLANVEFDGIGANSFGNFPSYFFNGSFDGNDKTISNMVVVNEIGNLATAGFFNGLGNNAIIKNIKFVNANVTSTHYAGVVAGYCQVAAGNGVETEPKAYIEGCHVEGSTVVSKAHKLADGTYDDGDKAGGIVGYMYYEIKNCSVVNSTVQAVRDLGGIAGIAYNPVSDCKVENVTLIRDSSRIDRNENIDSIVGRKEGNCEIKDCTGFAVLKIADGIVLNLSTGEYEVSSANGWVALANVDLSAHGTIKLVDNLYMTGIEYTPIKLGSYPVNIDGNNHFISGLSASLFTLINDGVNLDLTVKNLVVKESTVEYRGGTGAGNGVIIDHIVVGSLAIEKCGLDQVTVNGATEDPANNMQVGGFVGHVAGDSKLSVTSSYVINSTINGNSSGGGILGYTQSPKEVEINACTVSNITVTSRDNGGWRVGAIAGTLTGDSSVKLIESTVSGITLEMKNSKAENPGLELYGRALSNSKFIVDGKKIIADGLAVNSDGVLEVSNANGWVALANVDLSAHGTIKLVDDLYMTGIEYTPIKLGSYSVNIEGNNRFISGLSASLFTLINDGVNLDLTVKNLVVKESTVEYRGGTGAGNGVIIDHIVVGSLAIEKCGLDQVTVNGATEDPANNMQVGGFVGHVAGDSKLSVTSSYVINSTINGNSSGGGILGYTQSPKEVEINACTVSNITVTSRDNGGWRVGAIAGTLTGDSSVKLIESTVSGITLEMKNSKAENPGLELYGRALSNSKFIVDGKKIIADGLAVDSDGVLEVSNANGLMVLAEQKGVSKVDIVDDIDMNGKDWKGLFTNPNFAQAGITINGNGKSISHLCAPLVASTTYNVTINDLTIKDSEMVHSYKNAGFGAFVQYADYPEGGIVTLSKCHLVNSKLITEDDTRVGGLLGVVYGKAVVTDCTVEGCELSAKGAVGGIVAQTGDSTTDKKVEISNCSVTKTKLHSIDDGGWRVGAIVGSANLCTTCISKCTSTDNTLSQIGKTAPDHVLYGRKVNGGSIEIDGVAYVTALS